MELSRARLMSWARERDGSSGTGVSRDHNHLSGCSPAPATSGMCPEQYPRITSSRATAAGSAPFPRS